MGRAEAEYPSQEARGSSKEKRGGQSKEMRPASTEKRGSVSQDRRDPVMVGPWGTR